MLASAIVDGCTFTGSKGNTGQDGPAWLPQAEIEDQIQYFKVLEEARKSVKTEASSKTGKIVIDPARLLELGVMIWL